MIEHPMQTFLTVSFSDLSKLPAGLYEKLVARFPEHTVKVDGNDVCVSLRADQLDDEIAILKKWLANFEFDETVTARIVATSYSKENAQNAVVDIISEEQREGKIRIYVTASGSALDAMKKIEDDNVRAIGRFQVLDVAYGRVYVCDPYTSFNFRQAADFIARLSEVAGADANIWHKVKLVQPLELPRVEPGCAS